MAYQITKILKKEITRFNIFDRYDHPDILIKQK